MPAEESAIQLMSLPELWPPLAQEPGASDALPDSGYVQPLPLEHGPALTLEQGPTLPRQFGVLLAEVLAGVRPARQVAPWLSQRGSFHLQRLMPLFKSEQQPRVLRVLTARPTPDVVEMTMIVVIGPRPRALAIRLEHSAPTERWQCTDIEAA